MANDQTFTETGDIIKRLPRGDLQNLDHSSDQVNRVLLCNVYRANESLVDNQRFEKESDARWVVKVERPGAPSSIHIFACRFLTNKTGIVTEHPSDRVVRIDSPKSSHNHQRSHF
jgi:hypothetical protein